MQECLNEYVKKALSKSNRLPPEEETNYRYMIEIKMAEVGSEAKGKGNFCCRVTIPRQVNNELGRSISHEFFKRAEAVEFLETLIQELKS